jgi:predicted GH43/DUF377 family glycosyl hydrolase
VADRVADPVADGALVTTLDVTLGPDPTRTVIRPFMPSDPAPYATDGHPRAQRIVRRVLAMPPDVVTAQLGLSRASLDERHRDVHDILARRFEAVADLLPPDADPSDDVRQLIGAYLSAEYSFEAAALFNPSIVAAPDQSGCPDGDTRFILSLRGIGEGHLSSVIFRTGCWHADGSVAVDPPSPTAVPPIITEPQGWHDDDTVQLDCRGSREPSETVLFPVLEHQSRGIEDVRFTPFVGPDGRQTFAGTYTAVGEKGIRQELIQTDDFRTFKMHPIRGALAEAKGMALFPRQVGGCWLAVSRQDGENLWLARSDDLFTWDAGHKLLEPEQPWEVTQIGNCGSPIEIEEGWLVLTHGVGVVRNYCMGAALLDRDDPARVLGRLADPLIEPGRDTRDGYVPNVVYSCGALKRGRQLLLPYAVADEFTRFAAISLDALVARMRRR